MYPSPTFKFLCISGFLFLSVVLKAQLRWQNVDADFGPLPATAHVYKTTDSIDGKPNIAYYFEANLKEKSLDFTVDTTLGRRWKPSQFFERNDHPLLVVNTTFFSYETNSSQNVVIKDGELVGYNIQTINGRGKDTFTYRHPFVSALGITKKRKADVAFLISDSSERYAYANQTSVPAFKDSVPHPSFSYLKKTATQRMGDGNAPRFSKWKMQTAVGGGPTLVQEGQVAVSNDTELKFAGKAINDKHPRTAMGYTQDGRIIVLVVQGRFAGLAEGATLPQMAAMLRDIGCWEALNLDGGGSSCMLINGKETIQPCDKEGQRGVPAVFLVKGK